MTSHSPDSHILNMLYLFMVDIGMKPDNNEPEAKKSWVLRFYDILKTKNPNFPKDVSETKVWAAFTAAIFDGKAVRRANNIGALREAFDNWIKSDQHSLRKPKQEYAPTVEPDVKGRLETWPDKVLISQIRTIRAIGGGHNAWIMGTKGARGYCQRIINELNKRGISV